MVRKAQRGLVSLKKQSFGPLSHPESLFHLKHSPTSIPHVFYQKEGGKDSTSHEPQPLLPMCQVQTWASHQMETRKWMWLKSHCGFKRISAHLRTFSPKWQWLLQECVGHPPLIYFLTLQFLKKCWEIARPLQRFSLIWQKDCSWASLHSKTKSSPLRRASSHHLTAD